MSFFKLGKHHEPAAPAPTIPASQAKPPPINQNSRPQSNFPGLSELQQHLGTQQSSFGPKFLNIKQNATVYERVLLLHGNAGPSGSQFDASVIIYHHLNSFPSQRFPLSDGYFKALVHLEPGENLITVVFDPAPGMGIPSASSQLLINYLPLLQNPPLHLVLLVGKDSKLTFDSPDYKKQKEGNGLDLAIKKMRMAGYMFAAFTDEQMNRNKFGHRTFRLYEEWEPDTLSNRDTSVRSTAKVHIVRSEKTVAEILDPDKAQQNKNGKDTGALFGIALEALKAHGGPFNNGQTCHAAVIFLDTHWDPKLKLIRGHAALGGGSGDIRLAIFGGHALYTWPSCLEEVVPSFMDDTVTDTSQVANDSDQSGTNWENCNVGQGAFLHEIGHLLGCPHEPSGVMLRDYITWNRSFMTREAYCSRLGKPGMHLTLPNDECAWHRLDILRFRFHPSFKLPSEQKVYGSRPNVYPVENGAIVKSESGIYLIEIHDGEWDCKGHIEYLKPQNEIFLFEGDIFDKIDPKYHKDRLRLEILAVGEQQTTVDDFVKLSRDSIIHDSFGRGRGVLTAFKSVKLGNTNGEEQIKCFNPNIKSVTVHSGNAVDGLEFKYSDNSEPLLLGKRGGSPHELVLEPGEKFIGLFARTGFWVDALQVVTNRRRGPMCGNLTGGSGHDLVPPMGYEIVGVYGNIGSWCNSIGIIYLASGQ